jgi:C-terminal processing protease CtpA/Prc
VIENLELGGPAHRSGLLEVGDIITQIDHKPVSDTALNEACSSSDVPGSLIVFTAKKASSGREIDVILSPIATESNALGFQTFGLTGKLKVFFSLKI